MAREGLHVELPNIALVVICRVVLPGRKYSLICLRGSEATKDVPQEFDLLLEGEIAIAGGSAICLS